MARRTGTAPAIGEVKFEDVRIIYRNFSGLQQKFNEKGDRNFNLVLDEATAQAMKADGWNVRWPTARDPDDPPPPILKVNLRYRTRDGRPVRRPPRVVMITSRGKTFLPEALLQLLDLADIVQVDMIINPYEFEPGRFSAYLKAIYVTIREDELELKYADVPDSSALDALVQEENEED